MKKLKKGDVVRFVGSRRDGRVPEPYYSTTTEIPDQSMIIHGTLIWDGNPCKVVGISNGYVVVRYCGDGKTMQLGFKPESVEKTSGKSKVGMPGKTPKPVPVDKHVVIEDSCNNFHGVFNSYNDAVEKAKGISGNTTIYKMVEVATVATEKRVKKVPVKRK